MKGILKFLAAAKLVELSDEEKMKLHGVTPADELIATETASEAAPELSSLNPPPLPGNTNFNASLPPSTSYAVADVTNAAAGKSFEEIFKSAQIPDSSFPAERLLRLLDGLRTMDETTRKAAVHAMDAADDNWTIDDSIIDAQRKIAALEDYQKALQSQLTANQQQVISEVADLKQAEERAVTEIRKQIAEMERLLAREIQKTAEQITNLEGGQKAAQENCEREVKRLQTEVERLREIPAQFSH
ncbi:hypothetical protein ACO0LF_08120 [Undibacterium sp. Di27W]|uniref:hypothetical protein n=1 Tax=Undibacterium sp. Di27W TaxID=3413036 RepID=UPI003BF13442